MVLCDLLATGVESVSLIFEDMLTFLSELVLEMILSLEVVFLRIERGVIELSTGSNPACSDELWDTDDVEEFCLVNTALSTLIGSFDFRRNTNLGTFNAFIAIVSGQSLSSSAISSARKK